MNNHNSLPHSFDQHRSSRRKSPWSKLVSKIRGASVLTKAIFLAATTLLLFSAQAYGFYALGKSHGIAVQKKSTPDRATARTSAVRDTSNQNRWTYSGKVTAISDKSISIKSNGGQTQTAQIDDKTTIQKLDGTKVAPKDIKKDSTVLISGTKQDNGTQVAQRIRISNK